MIGSGMRLAVVAGVLAFGLGVARPAPAQQATTPETFLREGLRTCMEVRRGQLGVPQAHARMQVTVEIGDGLRRRMLSDNGRSVAAFWGMLTDVAPGDRQCSGEVRGTAIASDSLKRAIMEQVRQIYGRQPSLVEAEDGDEPGTRTETYMASRNDVVIVETVRQGGLTIVGFTHWWPIQDN